MKRLSVGLELVVLFLVMELKQRNGKRNVRNVCG